MISADFLIYIGVFYIYSSFQKYLSCQDWIKNLYGRDSITVGARSESKQGKRTNFTRIFFIRIFIIFTSFSIQFDRTSFKY